MKNKTIPIYAKGKNVREWIHVYDHVDAILHLINKGKIGQTYNIGSGKCLTNISLVEKICDIMDEKLKKRNLSENRETIYRKHEGTK